jgi:hypothetical protein
MRVVVPPQMADLVPGRMSILDSARFTAVLTSLVVVGSGPLSKEWRFVCKILISRTILAADMY